MKHKFCYYQDLVVNTPTYNTKPFLSKKLMFRITLFFGVRFVDMFIINRFHCGILSFFFPRSSFLFVPFFIYLTSKPSSRKHCLCNSINLIHSGSLSPLNTTHSSRCFLVSGQQQHIGLPLLIPNFFLGLFSSAYRI